MVALMALQWLLGTSVMPLFVGGGTGLAARRVLGAGRGPRWRPPAWAAAAAWALHLLLVVSGALREGAMLDYGAVLLASTAGAWLACRPR